MSKHDNLPAKGSRNHRPILRRGAIAVLGLFLFLSFAPVSHAENTLFPIGECSDDVLRVETRLSDLGYKRDAVDGRWDLSDSDALALFASQNQASGSTVEETLFSENALPASASASSVFASGNSGFLMTFGSLMPWSEVKTKLQTGTSYNITSCYSGITLHMVCVSLGEHAKFRPELDWDNATLRGFFTSTSSSEKQPVVLTLDGVLVAASIQQAAPSAEDEALPEYSVFFHDALTGINDIPDAEHETVIHAAANQG